MSRRYNFLRESAMALMCLISLSAFSTAEVPMILGDDPCGATSLPNNMLTFIEIELDGGPSGVEDPGCGEFNGNDNWYSTTVPASGSLAIELEAGTVINAAFALYYGPCSNPTLINCVPNYLCGEDPMPKYFYENLTPGATVYLRIWDEDGNGGTVFIRVSNPYGNPYLTTGSAQPVSFQGSSNCIQLTTEGPGQLGCAWYPEAQDFSEPFDYSYNLYFGTRDGTGADGMCIIFQNNGIPICGNSGEGIGAQGIPNSWIVEFDTWQNGNLGDPAEDHCGICINGVMNHGGHPPVALPNIEDGNFHTARVTWDPLSMTFTVFFDGVLQMSVVYDIVNLVFGGNPVAFWGVSASTGGAWNDHILCFENIELENLNPVYVTVDANSCFGEGYFAGGGYQFESGEYIDIYVAANGCDSVVTTNLEVWPEVPDSYIDTLLCEGEVLFYEGVFYNEPGAYEVILQNANGCDSLVNLAIEYVEIIGSISDPEILTCYDSITSIQVDVQGDLTHIKYFWYTPSGNILTDPSLPTIDVDAPGFYFVEVSFDNGEVQCGPLELSVFVEADQENPQIIFQVIGQLDCDEGTVFIDAGQSIGGSIYEWFATVGGDIIDGQGTPMIEVDGPGTYTLILTNEENGCISTADIDVALIEEPPFIDILTPDPLTCKDSSVWIDASNSEQQSYFIYEWSTLDGVILEGEDSLMVRVGAPGFYVLRILNTENNCESFQEVEILEDRDTIPIWIANPGMLLCKRTSVVLQLEPIPIPQPSVITWSTADGNIVSLSNGDTRATVDKTGTYQVVLVDEQNGCSSLASIEVEGDFESPISDAGDSVTLTCKNRELSLDGNGSSQGNRYTYQWQTAQGLIISGGQSLQPVIGRAGNYTLVVTDTVNGCTALDQVTVGADQALPEIKIEPALTLNCNQPSIRLDASNSPHQLPFRLSWSTIQGIIEEGGDTPTPLINKSGWYVLRILNETNGCTSEDSVQVKENFDAPDAVASGQGLFTCSTDSLILSGAGSSIGQTFSYLWSTADGSFIRGETTLSPVINRPGTYVLSVLNSENGCISTDTILVQADENIPIVTIAEPLILNCARPAVRLSATGSSDGSNFNYVWSSVNGTFQLVNKQLIEVISPGIYRLEILNTQNNCVGIQEVEVLQDTVLPVALIDQPLILNCRDSTVNTQVGVLTDDTQLDIRWSTTSGQIVSGQNDLKATFGKPGIYTLTLINQNNGCSQSFDVEVEEDRDPPIVQILPPDTLTCSRNEVNLNSIGSDQGSLFAYSWSSTHGWVFNDPGAPLQLVTSPGTYRLTIINTRNFCVEFRDVTVIENRVLPNAIINFPDTITCSSPVVVLDGSLSSQGTGYRYIWSTTDGIILTGTNGLSPEISSAGTYKLIVIDDRNGCSKETVVQVGINISAPEANAGPEQQLTCRNTNLQLQGSGSSIFGPVQYSWSTSQGLILNGETTANPLIGAPGVYKIVVTDPYNGCTAENEVIVYPNEDTIQSVQTRIVQPNCQLNAGAISFLTIEGGTEPYEFSIDGGLTFGSQREYNRQSPGQYRLIVRDSEGCLYRLDTVLKPVIPVRIDLPPFFIVPLGESVTLNPEANLTPVQIPQWRWEPPLYLDCYDCKEVRSTPLEEIRYVVTATDLNGCVDVAETLIRVVREGGVFIPSAFTPGDKNGLNDLFTVFGSADMIERVDFLEIFDRWGNRMFKRENFPINDEESGWDGSFREQPMNPGVFVYVAKVTFINGTSEVYHGDVTLIR